MKDVHLKIHWLDADKCPKAEPTLEKFYLVNRGIWEYSRLSNFLFCLSIASSIVSAILLIWLLPLYYELYLT